MMTIRVTKMMPANQRTTGFCMIRLKRARMKSSTLGRGRMVFNISTKVEGEGDNPYTESAFYIYSVSTLCHPPRWWDPRKCRQAFIWSE